MGWIKSAIKAAAKAAAGPVAGGLISGGLEYFSAKDANKQMKAAAREQMRFQERMSNTAHQREVADLRAAGLNPILSANTGASTPSGASYDVQQMDLAGATERGAATAREIAQSNAAIKLMKKQGEAQDASAKAANEAAEKTKFERTRKGPEEVAQIKAMVHNLAAQTINTAKATDLIQKNLISKDIENIRGQMELDAYSVLSPEARGWMELFSKMFGGSGAAGSAKKLSKMTPLGRRGK